MVDCVVIGDVIFDIFFENVENGTFSCRGTSYCNSAKIDFGGAGNVASALSLLGADVFFIGKAGNDLWGKVYKADLNAHSVASKIFRAKNSATGLALVLQERNCERSFFIFRGANDKLTKKEVDLATEVLKHSEFLYISGYSLVTDPQRAAILHAVSLAKKYNLKVVFDPSSHNLVESYFKIFEDLLDICDIFCPNMEEAEAITKSNELGKIIQRLQKRGRLVAVKCGQNGCIMIDESGVFKIEGSKVNPVDTTGAGDAFTAALIYGLLKNLPYCTIGKLANWFAAQTVRSFGARAFPPKSQVDKYVLRLRIKTQ